MNRNILEIAMGAVVVAIAGVFLVFAYSTAQIRSVTGYGVTAKFDHIEGIREGGDVRISGIKVGSIVKQSLDPLTYQAIVKMSIANDVKLPVDTVATITSSGLLGDKYLALIPGNDDKLINPDGVIKISQSPVSLEELLGKVVFSVTNQQKPADGQAAASPAGQPAR